MLVTRSDVACEQVRQRCSARAVEADHLARHDDASYTTPAAFEADHYRQNVTASEAATQ